MNLVAHHFIIKNPHQINLNEKIKKIVYPDEEKDDDIPSKPGRKKKEIPNPDELLFAIIPNKGRPVKNYQINEAEHIPLTNAIPVTTAMNRLLSPLFRRTASDQIVPTPF